MMQCYDDKEQLIHMMHGEDDGQLIEFATPELKENFMVAMNAVSLDGWAYFHLPIKLQLDQEICEAAVNQNGHLIKFIGLYNETLINIAIKSKPCLKNSNYISEKRKIMM
jgi:hypothetical protein